MAWQVRHCAAFVTSYFRISDICLPSGEDSTRYAAECGSSAVHVVPSLKSTNSCDLNRWA